MTYKELAQELLQQPIEFIARMGWTYPEIMEKLSNEYSTCISEIDKEKKILPFYGVLKGKAR